MSVHTTYDDKRDYLRDELKRCLDLASELVVGTSIWGYDDMREGYAVEVFQAILVAKNKV